MPRSIRIISRESRLALWQANYIAAILEQSGHDCKIITLKSTGDVDLISPIYEMGIEGVFTKELDIALLNNEADIAVHSMKDIPTLLAKGLMVGAVAERGDHEDILFVKPSFNPEKTENAVIASCSLRRRAQWLKRFPKHTMVNVRGNIDTRVEKFWTSNWDGMILAKAGVVRLGYSLDNTQTLPWMLPAPAQGAIAVVCREGDTETYNLIQPVNHLPTFQCTAIEREFLNLLQGGCSAPVCAYATIENDQISFVGSLYGTDGKLSYELKSHSARKDWKNVAREATEKIKKSDVAKIILNDILHSRQFVNGNR